MIELHDISFDGTLTTDKSPKERVVKRVAINPNYIVKVEETSPKLSEALGGIFTRVALTNGSVYVVVETFDQIRELCRKHAPTPELVKAVAKLNQKGLDIWDQIKTEWGLTFKDWLPDYYVKDRSVCAPSHAREYISDLNIVAKAGEAPAKPKTDWEQFKAGDRVIVRKDSVTWRGAFRRIDGRYLYIDNSEISYNGGKTWNRHAVNSDCFVKDGVTVERERASYAAGDIVRCPNRYSNAVEHRGRVAFANDEVILLLDAQVQAGGECRQLGPLLLRVENLTYVEKLEMAPPQPEYGLKELNT